MEKCDLQAVISMAPGFFQPYSGVGTAVLVFVKGGKTEKVWFCDMKADGYTLDLKRDFIDGKGDMPDVVKKFRGGRVVSDQSVLVPFDTIKKNDYNLSIARYKKVAHAELEYETPELLIDKTLKIEDEITRDLEALRKLIG